MEWHFVRYAGATTSRALTESNADSNSFTHPNTYTHANSNSRRVSECAG